MLCGNCEDYIRFVFYQLFGPVNQRQNCKGWERSGDLGASRLSGELRDYQVIIKLKLAWVSRSMILTPVTLPWLSLSVILAKTSIKGLILIIKSTYIKVDPWREPCTRNAHFCPLELRTNADMLLVGQRPLRTVANVYSSCMARRWVGRMWWLLLVLEASSY